ncbi:MAG: S41 family peptidase [Kangiellaceae bacterium]|nr:S41 family peptidase [Kangiellaceae bacterium]
MNYYTRFFFIASSLILTACSKPHLEIFPALDNPELVHEKIAPVKLRQDVDAFYSGVLERHPSIEKYADLPAIEQYLKILKQQINEPMTRREFFKVVGKLTHKFGDGHSMLIWPYQELNQWKEAERGLFPFSVYVDKNDRMFIRQSYTKPNGLKLSAGSEVLTINGVAAVKLINQMQMYAGGESEYLRKQFVAERIGTYLWAVFDIADNFEIRIEFKGTQHIKNISANDRWEMLAGEGSGVDKSSDFEYQLLKDKVGLLKVASFDVDTDWFEEFIDNSFAQMKKDRVTNLIIDIRENTGGNTDSALYLTSYLAGKDFRMISNMREKLNTDNRGWFDYKGDAGEIKQYEWDEWESPVDKEKRFQGKAYLLIGPVTYSAGIVFATTLQDYQMATLIGQETGGNANQTAQGNLFNLPHSKLRAYVTTRMLVRPSGSLDSGGVKPDVEVELTQRSLEQGTDLSLSQALQMIEQK